MVDTVRAEVREESSVNWDALRRWGCSFWWSWFSWCRVVSRLAAVFGSKSGAKCVMRSSPIFSALIARSSSSCLSLCSIWERRARR